MDPSLKYNPTRQLVDIKPGIGYENRTYVNEARLIINYSAASEYIDLTSYKPTDGKIWTIDK